MSGVVSPDRQVVFKCGGSGIHSDDELVPDVEERVRGEVVVSSTEVKGGYPTRSVLRVFGDMETNQKEGIDGHLCLLTLRNLHPSRCSGHLGPRVLVRHLLSTDSWSLWESLVLYLNGIQFEDY